MVCRRGLADLADLRPRVGLTVEHFSVITSSGNKIQSSGGGDGGDIGWCNTTCTADFLFFVVLSDDFVDR